jgi:NDP-sugar pyrophosphorylase family protein
MPDKQSPAVTKAVILAAGLGTRLGDLTRDRPKVMVPICGKPMLEHHVEWLRSAGVEEFFFNLHYLPEVITDHFGDGSRWGVSIRYSHEDRLQGTAGSLRAFRHFLDQRFLVQYGDVFSRLDVAALSRFHLDRAGSASLVVHPSSHPHDSDIVSLDGDGLISQIHHKPGDARFGNIGNAGAYLLEPVVFDHLSSDPCEDVDFCKDLFPEMQLQGHKLFGYNTDDLLLDVGTPERLAWIEQHLGKNT